MSKHQDYPENSVYVWMDFGRVEVLEAPEDYRACFPRIFQISKAITLNACVFTVSVFSLQKERIFAGIRRPTAGSC